MTQAKNKKQPPVGIVASDIPRGSKNKDARIFSERFVLLNGKRYYMRVFYGGMAEFVRYDTQAQKWMFLLFD